MADAYRIGSFATDTLTGRVALALTTIVFATTNNGVGYCFKRAAADYAVTAGKNCRITGLMEFGTTPITTGTFFEIRYADNAALTTNPVTLCGIPAIAVALTVPYIIPVLQLTAPATKYVGIFNASGTNQAVAGAYSAQLFGYEE